MVGGGLFPPLAVVVLTFDPLSPLLSVCEADLDRLRRSSSAPSLIKKNTQFFSNPAYRQTGGDNKMRHLLRPEKIMMNIRIFLWHQKCIRVLTSIFVSSCFVGLRTFNLWTCSIQWNLYIAEQLLLNSKGGGSDAEIHGTTAEMWIKCLHHQEQRTLDWRVKNLCVFLWREISLWRETWRKKSCCPCVLYYLLSGHITKRVQQLT